jgi:hypothetical protein
VPGSATITIGLSQNPEIDGPLAVAQAFATNVTLSLA